MATIDAKYEGELNIHHDAARPPLFLLRKDEKDEKTDIFVPQQELSMKSVTIDSCRQYFIQSLLVDSDSLCHDLGPAIVTFDEIKKNHDRWVSILSAQGAEVTRLVGVNDNSRSCGVQDPSLVNIHKANESTEASKSEIAENHLITHVPKYGCSIVTGRFWSVNIFDIDGGITLYTCLTSAAAKYAERQQRASLAQFGGSLGKLFQHVSKARKTLFIW